MPQLLAFDVGTETLPALALGRERAEPGLMQRPPRKRSESVNQPAMLLRAWLFLGVICAALAMAGFFCTAALSPDMLLFVAPFPFIVWGADELRRWAARRRARPGDSS